MSTPLRPPWATALAVMALLVLTGGCGRAGGEDFQPTHNGVVQVTGDGAVGQTVNPAGDTVAAVDLQVATYAQAPDPAGELEVALRDPATLDLLGSATLAGEDLQDLAWTPVTFDPPVPVGDVVLLEATWSGATSLALLANVPDTDDTGTRSGQDVLVNDPYGDGTLVVDGRPEPGDLTFRVRGTAGPTAFLGQLAEVAASAGSRLLAEPFFATSWVLAVLGGAVLAVRGLRNRRPG